MKIKKGDTVLVRAGKDKGKTGTVTRVYPDLNKVEVDGINVVKRHLKPSQSNPKGGIVEANAPIDVSNVGLINPDDKDRSSRVGHEYKGRDKVRVYRQADNKEVKSE
jgi:large subunit ribosomal protein L24